MPLVTEKPAAAFDLAQIRRGGDHAVRNAVNLCGGIWDGNMGVHKSGKFICRLILPDPYGGNLNDFVIGRT